VEWRVTAGRIWEAAFVAAAHVRRIHPGDWDHVLVVLIGLFKASAGVVAGLAAPALVAIGSQPGLARRFTAAAGTSAIGLVLAAMAHQVMLGGPWSGAVIVLGSAGTAVFALPAAALAARRSSPAIGIDAALWAYLLAELALLTLLSRLSAGAWLNYGIPATVFASTLAGRALARAIEAGPPMLAALPAVLASTAMLVSSFQGLKENERRAAVERSLADAIEGHLQRPRSGYYFTDRPGWNRLDGRLELVHDDWLYPVFESLGLAEPRSRWLVPSLVRGPIRTVISRDPGPFIERTTIDLRRLGYRHDVRLGPYFIWIR
jgi:hypothetical protein